MSFTVSRRAIIMNLQLFQIKESITENQTNFDLATKLVKDTKCTVTIPLCGKIAILVITISLIYGLVEFLTVIC